MKTDRRRLSPCKECRKRGWHARLCVTGNGAFLVRMALEQDELLKAMFPVSLVMEMARKLETT